MLGYEYVINKTAVQKQTRNQEFLRAGEVSENKGTLMNISCVSDERKALQGKILDIFFLETLKTAF